MVLLRPGAIKQHLSLTQSRLSVVHVFLNPYEHGDNGVAKLYPLHFCQYIRNLINNMCIECQALQEVSIL